MSKGYQTTEMWLTLAAVIVNALIVSDVFPVESPIAKIIAVAGAVLTTLGYTVSRTVVKNATSKTEAIKAASEATSENK